MRNEVCSTSVAHHLGIVTYYAACVCAIKHILLFYLLAPHGAKARLPKAGDGVTMHAISGRPSSSAAPPIALVEVFLCQLTSAMGRKQCTESACRYKVLT